MTQMQRIHEMRSGRDRDAFCGIVNMIVRAALAAECEVEHETVHSNKL